MVVEACVEELVDVTRVELEADVVVARLVDVVVVPAWVVVVTCDPAQVMSYTLTPSEKTFESLVNRNITELALNGPIVWLPLLPLDLYNSALLAELYT